MCPGVKVDIGAKDMAGHPGEKITEGLDERHRLVFETHEEGKGTDGLEVLQFFDAALKRIQAVSVHNHGKIQSCHRGPYQFSGVLIARNTGTDRNHSPSFRQLRDSMQRFGRDGSRIRLRQRFGHQLGMKTRNGRQCGLRRGHGRESGPGSEHGHPRHRRRSRFPQRASNHQHAPVTTFVRYRRSRPN
jgi:hypothetical protein